MESDLEQLLMLTREGSPESRARVLELLSDQLLFTPATAINRDGGNSEVRKISVVTMQVDGERLVPTFTTEDAFFAWSKDEYQCLSVQGSDLALSLPSGTGLIVNLGLSNECRLAADEVWQLSMVNDPEVEVAESGEGVNQLAALEDELAGLFRVTFSVREAYLAAVDRIPPGAVLGLNFRDATPGERFELTTKIAELSRKYFGEASSIEVFDDLSQDNSASRDLFSHSKPFFEREFATGASDSEPLADQIQQIHYYSGNPKKPRSSGPKDLSLLDRLSRFFQR